jgi:hypothetical protein
MRVQCISDHQLIQDTMAAVLASCWPDFTVELTDIELIGEDNTSWLVPVPPALVARIRAGQQESKWQNSATVPIAGAPTTVTLTFDPGTATEDD